MHILSFLEEVKALTKPVVTTNDVSRILGKGKRYANLYMHRAVKTGFLKSVMRGRYALKGTEPLAVASALIYPSYVSFLTALHYYGMSTQITNMITVAARRPMKDAEFEGLDIHAVILSKNRFFGFERMLVGGKYMFIAEREKAIIDSLLVPKHCPLAEVYEALEDKAIDIDKLIGYAIRAKNSALLKRLGFLLEKRRGIDIYVRARSGINNKVERLNPSLEKQGEKNRKWKIMINEVL